jgi:hypothetical protein
VNDLVVVEPGFEGLAVMLADLINGNIAKHPDRVSLINGHAATVNLHVHDIDMNIGLSFTGTELRIGETIGEPDMSITTDSDTLLEMTAVPLRFGMPDQLTTAGRSMAAKLLNGEVKVKGLPKQLPLMIRLQKLFTIT